MSAVRPDGRPGVMLVTDRRATADRPLREVVVAALSGGLDFVQVREKDLMGGALFRLVEDLVADARAATRRPARVVVNDRLDVALAARAAGVHLPSDGLPISEVRRRAGPRFLVGRSVHSPAEARQAEKAGAEYLIAGPVFATPSKMAFGEPLGVAGLSRILEAARVPVWAIGSIDPGNAAELKGLKIAGVAAIRAIVSAPDPAAAVRALRAAIGALDL